MNMGSTPVDGPASMRRQQREGGGGDEGDFVKSLCCIFCDERDENGVGLR